jgi:hypothetical protein
VADGIMPLFWSAARVRQNLSLAAYAAE